VASQQEDVLKDRRSEVRRLGFMAQGEALRHMEESDFLLLTMTDAGSLTGKLFEYFATGKPILAVGRRGGELERIIRETGAGWCAPPDEPEAVRAMLVEAVQQMQHAFEPKWEAIRRYDRRELAGEYAKLMKDARPGGRE